MADDYILTTKLFCGECKSPMVGESGTSCTKQVYHYYKCVSAKKHTGCHMEPIRKDWIEDLVINQISDILHDDNLIDDIIHMFMEFQQKENTVIPHLEHKLAETQKAINNMLKTIEQGIITTSTKQRLDSLEEKHRNIENEIIKEKMKRPQLTATQILRSDRYRTLLIFYPCIADLISAISAFMVTINSASLCSHSSMLEAYTLRMIRVPFTFGEQRPSHTFLLT